MKYGEKVMKKIVLVFAALMIVLGGFIVQVKQPISVVQAQSGLPPASNQVQASQGTVAAAGQVQMTLLSQPPVLSAERRKQLDAIEAKGPAAMPPLPEGNTAVTRADSVVYPSTQVAPPPAAAVNITSPGTFTIFRDTVLSHLIWYVAKVAEPTVVNSGPYVFMTANWMAAVSQDGGQTFNYIDPYYMFPASYGGFCCDQVAVYDPARDIFIWYLQYSSSAPAGTGHNIFRIAVARPADAVKGLWYFWDVTSPDNTEWDYPDVALSNDYLWITTNRGPYAGSYVDDAWIFKFPLDDLMAGGGLGYLFVDLGANSVYNLSLRMTRGAHETMYFGSHNTTAQVRIFSWAENSGSVGWADVNLSASWFNSLHNCTSPDGYNLCGFDDGRIKAGWVSNGKVGFMWGSSQGGGFTYPYVEGVRVKESDLTYLDRPIIWSTSGGLAYPAAAPNARGDLGVAAFFSGGGYYPYFLLGIDDDFSRDVGSSVLGPLEIQYLRSGYGPFGDRYGDYISVQQFNPTGLAWVASGFTLQDGSVSGYAEPSYTIFGRERDRPSTNLYMDQRYSTFVR
jgi:hypothetical protein